ncbi:RF-1 domain-containing protein [Sphingopyxis flava]|uniref:RF-1 domain-containing protein n=1 Tax=Sphingopyxis flava TaxID=1507287 RepID=A0A1T5CUN2_9SPHN|nr:RF-1 domain-containing protein [Sphingopyxis flava]
MIDADHVQIEIWPPRPKGGQHAGPGPSGVKVTHTLSGITACVDIGRSQFDNRSIAMDMILSAITHPRFRL